MTPHEENRERVATIPDQDPRRIDPIPEQHVRTCKMNFVNPETAR